MNTEHGVISQVIFRKGENSRKGQLKTGTKHYPKLTIKYFELGETKFQYINFSDILFPVSQTSNYYNGWMQIVQQGMVTLYKGIYSSTKYVDSKVQKYTTPGLIGIAVAIAAPEKLDTKKVNVWTSMWFLKKEGTPTILIAAPDNPEWEPTEYMLSEENKSHFISFIQSDSALALKIKNTPLLFTDIEKYVSEYNEWAKNQKK